MSWSRRDLLRAASALGLTSSLPLVQACNSSGPEYVYDGPSSDRELFIHGVASGDPLSDSVVLWTKVEMGDESTIEAYVEVYDDVDLSKRVAAAYVDAEASRNGCIKVDLEGLKAGRTYYYRFRCKDQTSVVGRTRTAPDKGGDSLRIALTSCSNFAYGWFHAYRFLAGREDIDLVLHAGDYIYEYGTGVYGNARPCEPSTDIVSLEDYRTRYSQYRRDPDLQDVHRQHPMIATWDDHETADNAWSDGANNHDEATQGPWAAREDAGRQAWFEWLPAREGADGILYRKLGWGDLADILVLDTRIEGREEQSGNTDVALAEDRQLLGEAQEDWLFQQLDETEARWQIILQQVVMTPWVADGVPPLNADQWDGYPAARRRLLDRIDANGLSAVVLTGDIHSSWVNDLPISTEDYDGETQVGSVAVEAVCPAVSSPGADLGGAEAFLADVRRNIRYVDTVLRGCVILDIDEARVLAQWWQFEDGVTEQETYAEPNLGATFRVDHGVPHWKETDEEMPSRDSDPLA